MCWFAMKISIDDNLGYTQLKTLFHISENQLRAIYILDHTGQLSFATAVFKGNS